MKLVLLAAQILYVFGAVHLSAWTVDKLDKLSKEQEANAAAEAEVQAVEAKKAEKERLLAEEKKEGKVRQRGKGKNKRKKKQVEDEREKEKEEARMAQEEEAEKAKRKAQQGTASSVVLRTIGIYCVGSLLLALLFFAHLPKSIYSTYSLPFYASPLYIKQTLQRIIKSKMFGADERAAAERAYKVLMVKENRELYDRFGTVQLDGGEMDVIMDYVFSLAQFVLTWLLISFIVSDSKRGRGGVLGLSIFVLTALAMFDGTTRALQWFHPCYHLVGLPVLGSLTVHEVLECLKEAGFPLFLACAVFYADYSFEDVLPFVQYTLELAKASQEDVDESCDMLLQTIKDRQAWNAQHNAEVKSSAAPKTAQGETTTESK